MSVASRAEERSTPRVSLQVLGDLETEPHASGYRRRDGYAQVRSGRSLSGVALLVVLLWALVATLAPLEFVALYSFNCLAMLGWLIVIPQYRVLSIGTDHVELLERALSYDRVTRVPRGDLRCVVFRHFGKRGPRVWIEATDRVLTVLDGANEDATKAQTLADELAAQLGVRCVRERAWGAREVMGAPGGHDSEQEG